MSAGRAIAAQRRDWWNSLARQAQEDYPDGWMGWTLSQIVKELKAEERDLRNKDGQEEQMWA